MRMERGRILLAAMLSALLAVVLAIPSSRAAEPADASEPPAAPRTEKILSAGLDLRAAYHTNPYYYMDDFSEGGMVLYAAPSVALNWPAGDMLFFGLDARLNYTSVLLDDEEYAESDEVWHPIVGATVKYNLGPHTAVAVNDTYQHANIPTDLDDTYFINQAAAMANHDLSDLLGVGIWGRNAILRSKRGGALFDFDENAGGLNLGWTLGRTGDGRNVALGLHASGGVRTFEEDDDAAVGAGGNPKDHTFYAGGASLTYPFSPVMTGEIFGGLGRRDYDSVTPAAEAAGRDSDTSSAYGGATLTLVPSGGPLSFVLAGAYEVTDTLVYSIRETQQSVFDHLDPLLNNLDTSYRQQDVTRLGTSARYLFSDHLSSEVSVVWQHAAADADEDLAPTTGQSGNDARDLDEDRWTIGWRADYAIHENVRLGLSYLHGLAEDGSDELYQYDSIGLTAHIGL